jgi:hypothetical protein
VPTPREEALARPLPERVPWEVAGPDFYRAWGRPRGKVQPEHIAIYGPTGSGKSWFERTILLERARLRGSHVVVVATKPADETLRSMGWPIVTSWPPKRRWRDKKGSHDQTIFWAKADGLNKEGREQQRAAIEDLLSQLWRPNSNTIVVFDELAYLEQELDLSTTITTYFREARSLGITIVANTQRPTGTTRWMHSESSWSVFFAPKDEEDAERLAQTAGDKVYFQRVLRELQRDKYEFLMVHSLTREAIISSIPKKLGRESGKPPVRDAKRTDHVV